MDLQSRALIREALACFELARAATIAVMEGGAGADPRLLNFIAAQLHYIGERSQSIYLLLDHGRLWDAEMVLRSVAEATLKCLFVLNSDLDSRSERLDEFWVVLGADADIRASHRAEVVLALAPDDDGRRCHHTRVPSHHARQDGLHPALRAGLAALA